MADKYLHPVRNGIVATVIGGLILSALPQMRGFWANAMSWAWAGVTWIWTDEAIANISYHYGTYVAFRRRMRMKNTTKLPPGWDEERVQRVFRHYDSLNEDERVAEDEAAFEDSTQTVMEVPNELVPAVRALLADRAT